MIQTTLLRSNVQCSLHLDSTLSELNLYDFQLEVDRSVQEVALAFEENPLLPAVILKDQHQFLGMLSRRQFLEQMSRPYGLDLFLRRPLRDLYPFTDTEALVLPSEMLIVEAAQQALQRSFEKLYEPIVIQVNPDTYHLLDVHQLLIAHSQIHQLATQLVNELYRKLENAHQALEKVAKTDHLTGVANRHYFSEQLQQEWLRLLREQAPLSLILCDIDHFKAYNDTYGHQAGDACIRQVAQAIRQATRRPADFVARYGGEEFVVILPNTPLQGALQVAKMVRSQVKSLAITHAASNVCHCVTLSLGVACLTPSSRWSADDLLKGADQALYQSKHQGRDRINFRQF